MDWVRTSVRQNAKSVKCLYRRDRENMPGSFREVCNAEEEGVKFIWLTNPKKFIGKAIRGSAPAQINVPRDYWTQVIDIELPPIVRFERQGGGKDAIERASSLLSKAKFPVLISYESSR